MISRRKYTIQFIFTVVFLALIPLNVAAVEYGGVGGRPANPDPDNPRSESIFIYELEGGESTEDAVLVANNSSTTADIELYATDSSKTNTGSFACEQKVEEDDDAGSWIKLSKTELTLEPNTSEKVPFTVNVPANAGVGEHNACIVIQEKTKEADTQGNIELSFRSGIRLAVTIPGEIEKNQTLSNFEIIENEDGYLFKIELRNNGNVSLDTNVKIDVGTFWGSTYFENMGSFPVLANDTSTFQYEMEKPYWGGIYFAQASASFNDDPNVGIGEKDGNIKTLFSDRKPIFVMPATRALLIELGLAFVVITLTAFYIYDRRRMKKLRSEWVEYSPQRKESIQDVAIARGVKWKDIARVNKLKAPYTVGEGEKILVPPREE